MRDGGFFFVEYGVVGLRGNCCLFVSMVGTFGVWGLGVDCFDLDSGHGGGQCVDIDELALSDGKD